MIKLHMLYCLLLDPSCTAATNFQGATFYASTQGGAPYKWEAHYQTLPACLGDAYLQIALFTQKYPVQVVEAGCGRA